jgi:hypothetical protein
MDKEVITSGQGVVADVAYPADLGFPASADERPGGGLAVASRVRPGRTTPAQPDADCSVIVCNTVRRRLREQFSAMS